MINWNSIFGKAKACMESDTKQREISQYIVRVVLGQEKLASGGSGSGSAHPIEDAGKQFISVMQSEIQSLAVPEKSEDFIYGNLGPTAVSALTNLEISDISARDDGTFVVSIRFADNLRRQSLVPERYPDGVSNIAALLNHGYGYPNGLHAVRGVWKGHGNDPIYSLIYREGAHFIENSINVFMRDYAKEYGVLRIEPSDEYILTSP